MQGISRQSESEAKSGRDRASRFWSLRAKVNQLLHKANNVRLNFIVWSALYEFGNPAWTYAIMTEEVILQYLKSFLGFRSHKQEAKACCYVCYSGSEIANDVVEIIGILVQPSTPHCKRL